MRGFFYMGWVFLLLAFAAAAAESVPRSLPGHDGGLVSAYDLWYAAKPGSLIVAQIRVERISPRLWDPLIVTLLALPAWLLFLAPGALLVWFCRPHREMTEAMREGLKNQEESFLLYEHLAREAKEAGLDGSEDDQRPDHVDLDIIASNGGMHPLEGEAAIDDLDREIPGDGKDKP